MRESTHWSVCGQGDICCLGSERLTAAAEAVLK
jgi:hypothetical protein